MTLCITSTHVSPMQCCKVNRKLSFLVDLGLLYPMHLVFHKRIHVQPSKRLQKIVSGMNRVNNQHLTSLTLDRLFDVDCFIKCFNPKSFVHISQYLIVTTRPVAPTQPLTHYVNIDVVSLLSMQLHQLIHNTFIY